MGDQDVDLRRPLVVVGHGCRGAEVEAVAVGVRLQLVGVGAEVVGRDGVVARHEQVHAELDAQARDLLRQRLGGLVARRKEREAAGLGDGLDQRRGRRPSRHRRSDDRKGGPERHGQAMVPSARSAATSAGA